MPARLDVDREAVRVLVVAVGVREAARQCNLSENTVLAWARRGEWLEPARNPPALPASMQPTPALNALKPADGLANVLNERHKKTKLGLSKYVREAAHMAAKSGGSLEIAQDVRHVAAIAETIWPTQSAAGSMTVNLLIQ